MNQLIASLQPLIKNASDATVVMPLIKDILDVAIKNDDHIVKLTAIVQRYISTKQTISGADSLLSDDEKKQLLQIAETTLSHELQDELETLQESEQQRIFNQRIAAAQSKLNPKSDELT